MKAILFVILNVSVCFPRGSVGVKILIQGEIWGGRTEKNFPGSLSLVMTPPSPCNTSLIFTLASTKNDPELNPD